MDNRGTLELIVDAHDAVPEGCSRRFKTRGAALTVTRIYWESDDGDEGPFDVVGLTADDTEIAAQRVDIEDSSAGISVLVYGGDHGLRLRWVGPGAPRGPAEIVEPYVVVGPGEVLA